MNTSIETGKNLLARLNKEQIEAVTQGFGPSLVIAGAGSGKTTVLTRRIAYLLSEMKQDPHSILAVTFTNKAAAEMKQRIEFLLGEQKVRSLAIGTFHSICARILRREIEFYRAPEGWSWGSNFVIYDETDSVNVVKSEIAKLNLDDKVYPAKEIKHAISAVKNDGLTAGRYAHMAKTHRESRIAQIYANYQGALASNNALDFDDLILIFNELLRSNQEVLAREHDRYRHILVDEFQDTNKAQYDLIRMLATGTSREGTQQFNEEERSLMVVGDVDQSIYSWRKADFRIILGFQNDFPNSRLVKLEENYRSTSTILEVANSIIANNTERLEKVLRCNRGEGSKVQAYEATDEIDEAYYVVEEIKRLQARGRNLSQTVILYRTNAQSRAIEEILIRNHIPYKLVGATRFYERQEIKDVLAYLKLIYNDKDSQAFLRVVNVPRRGIGKTSLERLYEYADENGMSLVEASLNLDNCDSIPNKARQALKDFALLVKRWQATAANGPVSELLALVLKESLYVEKLEEEASSSKDELVIGRLENLQELRAVAAEFEAIADETNLESFLTRISLVSDLDAIKEEGESITLMTLHSAKGLEFPIVFLMGLEEGLFPHSRSLNSPPALEEERRLMYVGVTRAADLLYMTLARRRMFAGGRFGNSGGFTSNFTIPSRFLKEIDPALMIGFYPQEEREPIERDSSPNFASPGFGSANNSNFGTSKPRFARYGQITEKPNVYSSSTSNYSGSRQNNNAPRMSSSTSGGNESNVTNEAYESLKVGDLVQHNKFGMGKVAQIIGDPGKELYNIEFQDAGKRLLDPRFAKLTKLS